MLFTAYKPYTLYPKMPTPSSTQHSEATCSERIPGSLLQSPLRLFLTTPSMRQHLTVMLARSRLSLVNHLPTHLIPPHLQPQALRQGTTPQPRTCTPSTHLFVGPPVPISPCPLHRQLYPKSRHLHQRTPRQPQTHHVSPTCHQYCRNVPFMSTLHKPHRAPPTPAPTSHTASQPPTSATLPQQVFPRLPPAPTPAWWLQNCHQYWLQNCSHALNTTSTWG